MNGMNDRLRLAGAADDFFAGGCPGATLPGTEFIGTPLPRVILVKENAEALADIIWIYRMDMIFLGAVADGFSSSRKNLPDRPQNPVYPVYPC